MHPTERLIADALMGKTNTDDAERQLGVQLAVQRQVTCPETGLVLDQRTAVLLTNRKTGRMSIVHPQAWTTLKAKLLTAMDKAELYKMLKVETWEAEEKA